MHEKVLLRQKKKNVSKTSIDFSYHFINGGYEKIILLNYLHIDLFYNPFLYPLEHPGKLVS